MNYEDLTIVIPIRIDTTERLRNLNIVIDQLTALKGLNIIILEADGQSKLPSMKDVDYCFIEDHDPLFHRTKYINILSKLADRKYLGVWDSDVIVPMEQLEQAMIMLRSQQADMVYPYDGRFINVVGDTFEIFLGNKNISELVEGAKKIPPSYGYHSCGGAFLVNHQSYIDAGGENEEFTSWGPEDLERFKRWEIRGYTIKRTTGAIYHLYHPIGRNSRYQNNETKKHMIKILLKTCNMIR